MSSKDFSWPDFAASIRGQYIISQALSLAVKELGEVDEPHREISNISDMQGLLDNLFTMFPASEQAKAEYLEATKGV
jgi:hypothetical protein